MPVPSGPTNGACQPPSTLCGTLTVDGYLMQPHFKNPNYHFKTAFRLESCDKIGCQKLSIYWICQRKNTQVSQIFVTEESRESGWLGGVTATNMSVKVVACFIYVNNQHVEMTNCFCSALFSHLLPKEPTRQFRHASQTTWTFLRSQTWQRWRGCPERDVRNAPIGTCWTGSNWHWHILILNCMCLFFTFALHTLWKALLVSLIKGHC